MQVLRRGLQPLFILRILLLITILPFCFSEAGVYPRLEPNKCVIDGEILIQQIDGKIIPTENWNKVTFKLSNNSNMSVLICNKHKEELKVEQYPDIIQAVIDRWEYEITTLNGWNEEQQQHYRDRFYNLTIVEKIQ